MKTANILLLLTHYASLEHDVAMNDVIGMATYLIGWSDFEPTTELEISAAFAELMEAGLIEMNPSGWSVSVEGFKYLFDVPLESDRITDLETLIDWYYGVFKGPDLKLMRA